MSDHLWVTGTHTYNGITGRMALHQTTYVPHRRSLRRQNILFFSPQKHFGITATRFESRRSSAVTEMPSSHQIALAITDPEGGKWTLNVTLMVLGREKMSQYYRQLATDLARSRTFIYVDCCSSFRGELRPTHNSVSQFHQSQQNSMADNTKSQPTMNGCACKMSDTSVQFNLVTLP